MSKILITGANGFVGQEVCRQLRNEGHTLTGTTRDRSLKAGPQNIPLYYLPEFSRDMDWSPMVAGAEAVVHLAARVHQMDDKASDPMSEYRRVNVDATKSLAIAAAAAGVKRFVFLSSIKVNGERTEGSPFSEEDAPEPVDPYGISKWEAEQALAEVSASTGMEVVILRSPLVYGPGVGGNFAVLARAVMKRRLLPLSGVTNRRSLVYVGNLAAALTVCLKSSEAPGETFLISDGEDLSTSDLIRRMAVAAGIQDNLFNCPVQLLRIAGLITGRRQTIARITESLEVNSSKIRSLLSWSPPYSVNEGLSETMGFFSDRIAIS